MSTSHSSGIGSSASSLHTLCPDSTVWSEGRRFEAGTSKDTIAEWLGILKGVFVGCSDPVNVLQFMTLSMRLLKI